MIRSDVARTVRDQRVLEMDSRLFQQQMLKFLGYAIDVIHLLTRCVDGLHRIVFLHQNDVSVSR